MKRYSQTAAIIAVLVFLLGAFTPLNADRTDEYYRKVRENLELFRDIYREVSTRYVDDIDPEEFIRAGIRGMLDTLDPYTVFIPESEAENLQIMTTGQYGGIGTVISIRGEDKILTVISPIEGTPAERLGIRAGDQIIEIDGISTEGFDTGKAAKVMRGEPGTEVKLKIRRSGMEEPIDYIIVREVINVKDVSIATIITDNIGYIKLTRFSRKAGDELEAAIDELDSQGMSALILDLRGNPGGLLESAVEVTEKFISKSQTIVSTRGMVPETNRIIESRCDPICGDCPLVVIVNGGSASASEIVSGAIQDLDRGVVIGQKTFGKGLVQSLVNFRNGTELKMTTAKYFTPSGRLIQKVDYFGSDNPVLLEDVTPDEGEPKEVKYFTIGGREVFGGGGITPDLEVEQGETSNLITALFRSSMFFNFANEYLTSFTAEDALNDDNLYHKFREFLRENDFDYKVDGQSQLEELKETAEEKKFSPDFKRHIEALQQMMAEIKSHNFEQQREDIERYLQMEFVYRNSGSEGRLRASLTGDEQLQKALQTLQNESAYKAILAGSISANSE